MAGLVMMENIMVANLICSNYLTSEQERRLENGGYLTYEERENIGQMVLGDVLAVTLCLVKKTRTA